MQDERIVRAVAIEERRMAERDEVLRREAHDQSLRTRGDFASRGLAMSGMVIAALIDIQVQRLRNVVLAACDIRREMARTVPELASEEQLNALRDRLHQKIDAEWKALTGTLSQYGYNQDLARIAGSAPYDSTTLSLKSEVTRALKNIEDEEALGMLRQSGATSGHIIINISGNVGGVNVGNIAGDMNAAINILEGPRGQALAARIKQITEAVAADTSLSPDDRAEAIETLAIITQEAALPPERRKWHLVQKLVAQVGSLLLKAPQLIDAWNGVHGALTSWFGSQLPSM